MTTDKPVWGPLLAALAFTALGALSGWIARRPAPAEPEGGAEEHERHLSPQTLANLGVTVDEVRPTSFARHVSIAGVVVDTPATEQPVHAPIGGRVETVQADVGTIVKPGETVVTLVRDPLPRPELTLTAEVLEPAQESLHQAVLDLRRSGEEVRIARTELQRVEQFTGRVDARELPILPRQREIDLRYALTRAETAHEQARLELQKHGLDEEQIAEVQEGAPLPRLDERAWKRALARNGLWPDAAERLSAALPEDLERLPWVVATIGELAASGIATDELAGWLAADAAAARHFLELGVLLQRGHTLTDVQRLQALNAFEPIVRVAAPPTREEGGAWDLHAVVVKPGAAVQDGAPLVVLRDPRRLLLRTEPVGSEVAAVLEAVTTGAALTARPLVRGSGPLLEDLHVAWVESAPDDEGTVAFVELENEVLARAAGERARTWALRSGVRYLIDVPAARLDDVYVLPAGAVADRGPDKVVFLQDGDDFRAVPVRVLHRDDEVAVLPAGEGAALFPGDRVVHTGAFALGLALNAGAAADPHAGHDH